MTTAVLIWQAIIFVSIAVAGRKRGWVVAFWIVWTMIQISALPLSVLQFGTIAIAAGLFAHRKPLDTSNAFASDANGGTTRASTLQATQSNAMPPQPSKSEDTLASWAARTDAWAEQQRLKLKFEQAAEESIKTEGFTCDLEERVMKEALARDRALVSEIESELSKDLVLTKLYHAVIAEGGGLPKAVQERQFKQRAAIKVAKAHRSSFDQVLSMGDSRETYFEMLRRFASIQSPAGEDVGDAHLYLLGRHWNEWLADVEASRARVKTPTQTVSSPVSAPRIASGDLTRIFGVVVAEKSPQSKPAVPKSAYVTRHTFTRLGKKFLRPADVSVDAIYDYIYEKSLAEVLNHAEASSLYVQKRMIEGKADELTFSESKFFPNYVFSVGQPKFHASKDCEFLQSDFVNYLVPPEIKVLGPEKVVAFQRFCEDNKRIFREKSPDVFWAHVGAHFKVSIRPKPVQYGNSGISNSDRMTVDTIKARIEEVLAQAHTMLDDDVANGLLKRFRYAGKWKQALAQVDDATAKALVEKFFDLKRDLLNLLFEFYKKSQGVEDLALPADLLNLGGLAPCKVCWPASHAECTS